MYKYEKKIKELSLQKSSLPKSLNTPIKELHEAEKELEDLKNDLSRLDEDDDSREDIESQMNEYQKMIDEADDELVNKIQKYADKKPYYDAKYQHMKEAAEAKKAAKAQENTAIPESGSIALSGSGSVLTSATPEVLVQPSENKVEISVSGGETLESGEKKKDDFGTWLFWGLLGTAGILVGVNLFKNRR